MVHVAVWTGVDLLQRYLVASGTAHAGMSGGRKHKV